MLKLPREFRLQRLQNSILAPPPGLEGAPPCRTLSVSVHHGLCQATHSNCRAAGREKSAKPRSTFAKGITALLLRGGPEIKIMACMTIAQCVNDFGLDVFAATIYCWFPSVASRFGLLLESLTCLPASFRQMRVCYLVSLPSTALSLAEGNLWDYQALCAPEVQKGCSQTSVQPDRKT